MGALMRQRRTILDEHEEEPPPDIVIPSVKKADASEMLSRVLGAVGGAAHAVNSAANYVMPKGAPEATAAAAPENSPKGVGIQDLIAGGVIIPTGILGGLHLSRGAFQAWRRKDLQDRLKTEEAAYMDAIHREASHNKSAADEPRQPLSMTNLALMGVLGLPFLSAATSGLLTDRILSQQFQQKRPRLDRTRVRFADEPDQEAELAAKQAADLAQDLLIHTVLEFPKAARDAGVSDLVGAVAAGRLVDMESMLSKQGHEAMFELAEGCARHVPTDPLLKCAAVRSLMKSACAAPASVMAAAVFKTQAPSWTARGADIAAFPKMAAACEVFGGLAVAAHIAAVAGTETFDKVASMTLPAGLNLDSVFDAPASESGTAATGVSTLQSGATDALRSDGSIPVQDSAVKDQVDAALTRGTAPV